MKLLLIVQKHVLASQQKKRGMQQKDYARTISYEQDTQKYVNN